MNERWLGEKYIVLFEEKAPELERAYGLSDVLPGYKLVGLLGGEDFVVEDNNGSLFTFPTVPLADRSLKPFSFQDSPPKLTADCERSIAIRPNHSTTYINRGHCFAGLGNAERAANDFRFALARPCEPSESDRKEALDGLRSLGLDPKA